MFDKFLFRSVATLMTAVLVVAPASAATITHGGTTIAMDFVSVGNTGNVGDVQSQGTFGAVDYAYNIGTYEVTENQWDVVNDASTTDLLDDVGYWSGDQPVTHISWNEAAMFCNWLTSGDVTNGAYAINDSGVVTGTDRDSAISAHGTVYVIPTENEWYKAAYYDGGTSMYYDYPAVSDTVPDGIDFSGDIEFDAVFHDGCNQGHPNDVDDAGVLSPYGTMGQGGNVWEWNETAIGSSRGVRGGSWYNSSDSLAASICINSNPKNEISGTGFRVASVVPEPSSVTLLVCGLIGLLAYAWRKRK